MAQPASADPERRRSIQRADDRSDGRRATVRHVARVDRAPGRGVEWAVRPLRHRRSPAPKARPTVSQQRRMTISSTPCSCTPPPTRPARLRVDPRVGSVGLCGGDLRRARRCWVPRCNRVGRQRRNPPARSRRRLDRAAVRSDPHGTRRGRHPRRVQDVSVVTSGRAVSTIVQQSFGGTIDEQWVEDVINLAAKRLADQFGHPE